jgi:plastocyanin
MKKIIIITSIFVLFFGLFVFERLRNNDASRNIIQKDTAKILEQKIPENTIFIEKYEFKPNTLTIQKGTTVTWINKDIAKHTVTKKEGAASGPESKFFGKDEQYTYTFTESGTFDYYCEPHPYMKGTVEVIK